MTDIVQRLDYWRGEMHRTIKALESNPKFADVVEGNRSIYTTLGMAKTEITFSRTTITNLEASLRAAEEREKALREALKVIEAKASDFVQAVDRYNEEHGEFIGGAPIFHLAKAIAAARQALAGAKP